MVTSATTKLLDEESLDPKLRQDLEAISQVDTDLLKKIGAHWVEHTLLSLTTALPPKLSEELTLTIAKEVPKEHAESLVRFCRFVVQAASELRVQASSAQLLEELSAHFEPDESARAKLEALIDTIFARSVDLRSLQLRRQTEEFGPPSFAGIGVAVDARALNAKVLDLRAIDQGYAPQIVGFSCRGTIALRLARHTEERVVFQLTKQELELLIASLESLHKDIEAVDAMLSRKERKS